MTFDPSSPPWLVLAGLILSFIYKWLEENGYRQRTALQIEELKATNTKQQSTIDRLRRLVKRMRKQTAAHYENEHQQRLLKHHFYGLVNAAWMVILLYRESHGRHQADQFEWNPSEPMDAIAKDIDHQIAEHEEKPPSP